jgi:1-phosphofructokinase
VNGRGVVTGDAPVARPRSSVGAGDALLAGFLSMIVPDEKHAGKQTENHTTGSQRALHEALAWGAAAVSLPGSQMPGPADLRRDRVRIHSQPDEIRPLLAS